MVRVRPNRLQQTGGIVRVVPGGAKGNHLTSIGNDQSIQNGPIRPGALESLVASDGQVRRGKRGTVSFHPTGEQNWGADGVEVVTRGQRGGWQVIQGADHEARGGG